jgi:hypothetical protein
LRKVVKTDGSSWHLGPMIINTDTLILLSMLLGAVTSVP